MRVWPRSHVLRPVVSQEWWENMSAYLCQLRETLAFLSLTIQWVKEIILIESPLTLFILTHHPHYWYFVLMVLGCLWPLLHLKSSKDSHGSMSIRFMSGSIGSLWEWHVEDFCLFCFLEGMSRGRAYNLLHHWPYLDSNPA